MNNNVYDTANQLERDLRSLPAFIQLKEAFASIKADEEANALFEEFKTASQTYQMKQMTSQAPNEAEIEQLQALSAKVSENDMIKQLMQHEQQLSRVMEDINRIITAPLQELYTNK